jgi:PAS domain S-box-containing protein
LVWVRDEAALVRDEEGGPLYWQGVLLDVTERKLAEEQLLFQAHLLEQVKAAVIATDMHGTVTHWNEHAEKLYLWSREEALGHNIAQLTVGPTEAEVAERIMERLRAGETWEGEFVVSRKDGFTFSAYVTDSLIRDADGNAVGIVGVSTDITELKRTEEELKESEERFRAFFETAAVGASQADPTTGRFLQVNEKLCRFLGYGREELLSMTFPDVTHPDDRAHDLEGISHLLLGETHEYTTEKRYVRKDGQTVWGQVAVSLVKDAAGRALQAIAVTQDISARKAAEEALLEIREAERRRIARDLHDVVLQDLAGVLQGLQATQVESEASTHATDLRPEIEALRTAVGSLRNAIYDLRLEGKQTFVRAVESLVELNRQLAPEREITLTVGDGFPPELPDGMDVEVLRVLREALANIRRHSDARCVEVVLSNGRDRARVEVTDDGRGFDAASIRAGVGLSGMRERASEIGGELEVESGPGQGTRVKVEFPL